MNSLTIILDKLKIINHDDFANILGIRSDYFSRMIKRNKVPYEELFNYCYENKININQLLYNQSFKSIFKKEEVKKNYIRYFKNMTINTTSGLVYVNGVAI